MSAADPRLKKLKIQTGVVKRCGKEKLSYRKEANQQKEKVEKMKAEGREEKSLALDELKEFLESVSLTEKTKAEQEQADAQQSVLNKAPLSIYIG